MRCDACGMDGSPQYLTILCGTWQEYEMKESGRMEEKLGSLPMVLKYSILLCICLFAFSIRLFAVVRYESVIHEFDPYFNFRTTKYLAHEGFLEFLDWFDDRGWYPLGRTIGGTIYPGLMLTASMLYWTLNAVNITVNIRNVCVFLAPIFSCGQCVSGEVSIQMICQAKKIIFHLLDSLI